MKIFSTSVYKVIALQADAVKIVIAQSKPNDSKLELNEADFDLPYGTQSDECDLSQIRTFRT